jgi:hypothetical protein
MSARILIVIGLYLAAIVTANLLATEFAKNGHPEYTAITAFGLVAFDLVARDLLHDWFTGTRRILILTALILAGSVLSYLANPDSATIAQWSAIVYNLARYRQWLERTNASNITGATVDSVVFVAGLGFPAMVAFNQTTAKIAGGLIFALALQHLAARRRTDLKIDAAGFARA